MVLSILEAKGNKLGLEPAIGPFRFFPDIVDKGVSRMVGCGRMFLLRLYRPGAIIVSREEHVGMERGCGDFSKVKPVGERKGFLVESGSADDEYLFVGTDMT